MARECKSGGANRKPKPPAIRETSGDGDDAGDFGDALAEVALDSHLEGHRGRGAAVTGAVEADLDDAVVAHLDQLDVAAVRLNGRADEVEDALHPLPHGRFASGGLGHKASSLHRFREDYTDQSTGRQTGPRDGWRGPQK